MGREKKNKKISYTLTPDSIHMEAPDNAPSCAVMPRLPNWIYPLGGSPSYRDVQGNSLLLPPSI